MQTTKSRPNGNPELLGEAVIGTPLQVERSHFHDLHSFQFPSMGLWAATYLHIGTRSQLGSRSALQGTIPHVIKMGSENEMGWPNTLGVIARVHYLASIWRNSICKRIGHAMGKLAYAIVCQPAVSPDSIGVASPFDAGIIKRFKLKQPAQVVYAFATNATISHKLNYTTRVAIL